MLATGGMFDILLFHAGPFGEYVAGIAFTRDGRLLGWSEPDGYYFIDLGRKPASKD